MGEMLNKIATGLAGFGAGVQGKGAQFLQQLDENRQMAMAEDAFKLQGALNNNDISGARDLLMQRVGHLGTLNGDSSDSQGYLDRLNAGDVQGVLQDINTDVDYAYSAGLLKPPAAPANRNTQVVGGQLVDRNTGVATPIKGFDRNAPEAQRRERELALKERIEKRQATKLSAGLEKVQLGAADNVIKYQGDAINFQTMANEFANRPDDLYGGVMMTLNERFKSLLGSQDDVTELRRKLNSIRVSEGIGNLPPGVASDKDIELVMSGQIQENASPEQVVQYLTGATKAAQYSAAYNQLKADFITKKRTGAGVNQAYRSSFQAPVLKRKVSVAEIYRTAQIRGITPEAVAQQLGITEELF